MEAETIKVQTPEASVAAHVMEVPKRDAANDSGAADVEEPPTKKARLDEPSKPAHVDMRDKGIVPIKAEHVPLPINDHQTLTVAI